MRPEASTIKTCFKPALGGVAAIALWLLTANVASAAFLSSAGRPIPISPEEFLSPGSELSGDGLSDLSAPEENASTAGDVDIGETLIPDPGDLGQEDSTAAVNPSIIDVPVVFNDSVETYLNYFQYDIHDRFNAWLERSGRYVGMMTEIFKRYGLPEDLVYLSLIESGFNPKAHSRAHAVGAWQFIRGTGRLYQLKINPWVDERKDPIKATIAAARHLKDLYAKFNSWPLALASYNAGARKIERGLIKAKTTDYWNLRKSRHIRRETKGYVPKYMAALLIAKDPAQYGFDPDYQEPFAYEEVGVPGLASLRVIAKSAGISYASLRDLNPELRTVITPPTKGKYQIRLPIGTKETFESNYAKIPVEKKLFRSRYVVRRNDTLSGIAKRYGTTVSLIARTNRISRRHILHIGDVLYIPKAGPGGSRHLVRKSRVRKVSAGRTRHAEGQIVYKVQSGDTLWDISKAFNIRLSTLRKHNRLGRHSLIHPGDILILGYK
jgi:membrane-bound lytic murein transglycosylase D